MNELRCTRVVLDDELKRLTREGNMIRSVAPVTDDDVDHDYVVRYERRTEIREDA